jgi:hypothetical protein
MCIEYHNIYVVIESYDGGKTWEYQSEHRFYDKKADALKEMDTWNEHHPNIMRRVMRFRPN